MATRGRPRSAHYAYDPAATRCPSERKSRCRSTWRGRPCERALRGCRAFAARAFTRSAALQSVRGGRRAARGPGRRLRRSACRAEPAGPGEGGDDDRPALGGGVDRGREMPMATPTAPPASPSRIASERNWVRICPRVAPSARLSPISERRSSTLMTMMFATPTAPTSSATAPSPRNRPLNAPWASARAVSVADGWLTFTSLGASGFAVAASTDWTAGPGCSGRAGRRCWDAR